MIDRDRLQQWLDAYVDAWRTYEPEQIGALFTDDATYAVSPWADPIRGREAIVGGWLANPDDPGSWEAEYHPVAVEGNVGVAEGRTTYLPDDAYVNLFVLEFDDEGRCSSFVDWFLKVPQEG